MKVYYLPGDMRGAFCLSSQNVSKSLSKLNKKIKSIIVNLQPAMNSVAIQFIKMAQKFNEEVQRNQIIELNELNALNSFKNMMSLEEYFESLKEKKNLEHKEAILLKPIKCIRATKVNNKKAKIIYYHIRSNC